LWIVLFWKDFGRYGVCLPCKKRLESELKFGALFADRLNVLKLFGTLDFVVEAWLKISDENEQTFHPTCSTRVNFDF